MENIDVAAGASVGVGDGRGARWANRLGSSGPRLLRLALIAVLLILVVYPLVWVFLRGLLTEAGALSTEPLAATYRRPILRDALRNSAIVAVSVSVASGVFGIFLAWSVARTDAHLRRFIERLAIVPFITTPLVGAFAWVVLATPNTGLLNVYIFEPLGFTVDIYSLGGMILVMSLYLSPYVFLLAAGAFKQIDPSLEEASVIAGRTRLSSFVRVTLPLALPALLAAMILTMVTAFEQFGVPAILGLPRGIYLLTTLIFQFMNQFPADYAGTSAVAVLLLALAAIFVVVQRRVLGNKRSYVTIGGREFRPSRLTLGVWRWPVTIVCLAYIALAVVLPFAGLIIVSLNQLWTGSVDPTSFSIVNYVALLQREVVQLALWNSFRLALLGAGVAIVVTGIAAYMIKRMNIRGRGVIVFLTTLPVAVPGIVLAVGLFNAYIRPPLVLYGTIWILYIAYITRFLPYGMRSSEAAVEQVSRELEESARVCGSGWLRTFRTVVVPLIAPGLLAGGTLMFIAMMRELSSSILLYTQPTIVNAVLLVDMWEGGEIELLAAFAVLITAITFVVLGIVQRLTRVDLTSRS